MAIIFLAKEIFFLLAIWPVFGQFHAWPKEFNAPSHRVWNLASFSKTGQKFGQLATLSAGGAKGWWDHRFRAPPACIAQLLTLHQHRAKKPV